MKVFRLRIAGLFLTFAIVISLLAPASHAGSLSSDVIGLFPTSVGEFAYADLRQARTFPWFAQLKEQMLPAKFRQFEQFLASAGMDPNTQDVLEITRARVSIAEAYADMGRGDDAWRVYRRALDEAAGFVNPRPRALAAVEICASIGRRQWAFDEIWRKELDVLLAGLKDR